MQQAAVGAALFCAFLGMWFGVQALLPEKLPPEDPGTPVFLYYYDEARDRDAQKQVRCSSRGLVPVTRTVHGSDPITETFKLLLAGVVTDEERALGLTAHFPLAHVGLKAAQLDARGTLTLSLSDPRHNTSGGACRVAILRAQLEATARQFDGVVRVVFEPSDVLQP